MGKIHCGLHQQAGELGAHPKSLKSINPTPSLLGTASSPRLRQELARKGMTKKAKVRRN